MQKFILIGNAIHNSLSPLIHKKFAQQFGLQIDYSLQEIMAKDLNATIEQFIAAGGRGINLTAPYKLAVAKYATQLNLCAQRAGAINTLSINPSGNVIGYNTDGIGLLRDLDRHAIDIKKLNILILGAGGVVRGILPDLLSRGPRQVLIANRDINQAINVAKDMANLGMVVAVEKEHKQISFDLIINATSADPAENYLLKLLDNCKLQDTIFYDLNYGNKARQMCQIMQQMGTKQTLNGYGMLLEQAAEAFYIWHGLRPRITPVLAQLHASTGQISALEDL